MTDESEIVTLLREIRDLQREHFEYYKQFTTESLKRREELKDQLSANRAERMGHAQQTREEFKHGLRGSTALGWVSAALQAILIVLIAIYLLHHQ